VSAWRLVGLAILAVLVGGVLYGIVQLVESNQRQNALDPFYAPPDPIPVTGGTVIRTEPMDIDVPGGTAQRILYVSERADGSPAVSGGMLFIPDAPAPEGGRPVVAWEHGTLGMGDACVPSRSANPMADMTTWIGPMMEQGWVVVATDYVGLGTPKPNQYLIAQSEVRDVRPAPSRRRTLAIATSPSATRRAATHPSGPAISAPSTHRSCNSSPWRQQHPHSTCARSRRRNGTRRSAG
jgi:hypothetical protein